MEEKEKRMVAKQQSTGTRQRSDLRPLGCRNLIDCSHVNNDRVLI